MFASTGGLTDAFGTLSAAALDAAAPCTAAPTRRVPGQEVPNDPPRGRLRDLGYADSSPEPLERSPSGSQMSQDTPSKGDVRCQGCWVERSTLKPSGAVSVEENHGKFCLCRGVKVLTPVILIGGLSFGWHRNERTRQTNTGKGKGGSRQG